MADDRTYIRVHDGLTDHPKVEPLSDAAFRLLMTTWCWCSRQRTDGHVRADVWAKRGTPKARRELAAAGLVELLEDGNYYMHDYDEHQRSSAEIAEYAERKRRAGAKGNHNRWHVAEGKLDPDCEWCAADVPPPPEDGEEWEPSPPDESLNGSHKASHVRSQPDSHMGSQQRSTADRSRLSQCDRKTSPEAEAEAEAEKGSYVGGVPHHPNAREKSPPRRPPRTCPAHHGDPDPPRCGRCADARRAADAWQPPTTVPPPIGGVIRAMPERDPDVASRGAAAARAALAERAKPADVVELHPSATEVASA